jgi:hypothetical protein
VKEESEESKEEWRGEYGRRGRGGEWLEVVKRELAITFLFKALFKVCEGTKEETILMR